MSLVEERRPTAAPSTVPAGLAVPSSTQPPAAVPAVPVVVPARRVDPDPFPPAGTPPPRGPSGVATAVGLLGVLAADLVVLTPLHVPLLGPVLGLWLLVGCPVALLAGTSLWSTGSTGERLGFGVAGTLLLLMVGGLVLDVLLPLVGVDHPLATVPVVLLGNAIALGLYLVRRRFPERLDWVGGLVSSSPRERVVVAVPALGIAVAVMGAIRLNNGAGGSVGTIALVIQVAGLLLAFAARERVRDGTLELSLYLTSLALLLMTSLRGWSVTGHDIQREFRVFQLTAAHDRWSIGAFHDAYNACLSVTILPTVLSRVLDVEPQYVYKVFFQLIFALCPVLVYVLAQRFWPRHIALLGAVYFIGFPTFCNDLPFLNRQEIAFLFIGVAMLALTNKRLKSHRRRALILTAAVGLELAHYSTMYIFLGIAGVAVAANLVVATIRPVWRDRGRGVAVALRSRRREREASWITGRGTVGVGTLALLTLFTFLWGGLATRTAQGALPVMVAAVKGLVGGPDARSGAVSYSIVPGGGRAPTPAEELAAYNALTLTGRTADEVQAFYPKDIVSRYRIPSLTSPEDLPLTAAGRAVTALGVPVPAVNALVRQAAAGGEQLFLLIGLGTVLFLRRHRRAVSREYYFLCVGSVAMVGVMTVAPGLSVEYGLLRAFQEALILVAPLIAVGSLTVFRLLGEVWSLRAAAAVSLGVFFSTTGLMPQLLGGYPPQLSLNAEGIYYDLYYVQPQEVAAVGWLAHQPGVLPDGLQTSYSPDRFYFTQPGSVTGQELVTEIYPTLVRRSTWVLLGEATARRGTNSVFYNGDLLTYSYPMAFLQEVKNRVYDSGGTEIYR